MGEPEAAPDTAIRDVLESRGIGVSGPGTLKLREQVGPTADEHAISDAALNVGAAAGRCLRRDLTLRDPCWREVRPADVWTAALGRTHEWKSGALSPRPGRAPRGPQRRPGPRIGANTAVHLPWAARVLQVRGPIVLQVASTTNVAQPKDQGDRDPCILMLRLTDGHRKIQALAHHPVPGLRCVRHRRRDTARAAYRSPPPTHCSTATRRRRERRSGSRGRPVRPGSRCCRPPVALCSAASCRGWSTLGLGPARCGPCASGAGERRARRGRGLPPL